LLTLGAAFCPAHTRVFGGGVFSSSSSTSINIDDTFPVNDGHGITSWNVYLSNATGSASNFTVYAICRPNTVGWSVQQSAIVPEAAGTQMEVSLTCPAGTVPTSGGGGSQIQNGDLAVTMNSSAPSGSGWNTWENNGESTSRDIDAQGVCAGP
jgi:hypothetical protein